MKIIKSETIEHARPMYYGNDSVIVTMLQAVNGKYYVVKETPCTTVWEIEQATKQHAENVYKNIVELANLAAGN